MPVLLSTLIVLGSFSSAYADTDTDGSFDYGRWYYTWFGIEDINSSGIDGSGVNVAVIDSAIFTGLPTLEESDVSVHEPSFCYNQDGSSNPAEVDDPYKASHGANVVSFLNGSGAAYGDDYITGVRGIAPGAAVTFYAVGMPEDDCYTASGQLDNGWGHSLGDAIETAVDDGADIISVSLGTTLNSGSIREAVVYAQQQEVVLVFATPNEEASESVGTYFPAAYNGVVGVASVQPDGTPRDDYLSMPISSKYIDIAAPGTDLLFQGDGLSSWNDLYYAAGSSFATPIVAGNIALAMQKYPDATPNQILQLMVHNTTTGQATQPHTPLMDSKSNYGYGIINTQAMLSDDPSQYDDVNPFLAEKSDYGPEISEILSDGQAITPDSEPAQLTAIPAAITWDETYQGDKNIISGLTSPATMIMAASYFLLVSSLVWLFMSVYRVPKNKRSA